MDPAHPLFPVTPPEFSLDEVTVRLIQSEERGRWDQLMQTHHYLGFKRFAGRGLRYVFEWRGQWLGLAGWQTGAFQSAPRDRWVGWKGKIRYERLHLIGNNTRFLILGAPGVFVNLASMALSAMTRRLSDDWFDQYGHGLLIAESFVDPAHFEGSMYCAANWVNLGKTKGYARSGGQYTDPHGQKKDLYVRALRADARKVLCRKGTLPERFSPSPGGPGMKPVQMRTLYEELLEVEDFRRPQGRKHTMASAIATYLLARISGFVGLADAAQFAKSLTQKELQALGAWCNPRTGRYEAVSKSTLHRVLQQADPDALEQVLRRYSVPRLQIGQAVAADGKRIRADHYESVTLVEHGTGQPVNSLTIHDESGEQAAVHALLEPIDVRGRVITVDALHTVRALAHSIVETHQADYLMTVKGNAPQTHAQLSTVRWDKQATGSWTSDVEMEPGRIERRSIQTLVPLKKWINYPHVAQVFRIRRPRYHLKDGTDSGEVVYGITSVPPECGSPEQLLEWNRGHWAVENLNHRHRDVNFAEEACLTRTGHGPGNHALCNHLALAVIFNHGARKVAQQMKHFVLHREEALNAILT